jgi:prepilin-type N-terminal cleavage/methylation domain-containing protein
MRKNSRRRTPRGTSLIEMMIAMGILSIGILGVLQMSILASQQNAYAARLAAASVTARDLVDAVERLPYSHPALEIPAGANTEMFTVFDVQQNVYTMEWQNAAPLLSAAPAILKADRHAASAVGIQKVWWTVERDLDDDGNEMAKHIRIHVDVGIPGFQPRTLNFWTVKYNPTQLVGTSLNFTEI